MKKYIPSFFLALLIHIGIFWIPMEELEENVDEEMLISIQMMNEEQEQKPNPPKKTSPPPPLPPVKKVLVKPKDVMPEKEEVAEEEVIVEKKVEPAQEIKKITAKTDPKAKSAKNLNAEPTVVESSSLDNADFKPFGNKKPVYPTLARKAGIEGWVKVKVLVDEKGKVLQYNVVDYYGHPSFKQATLDVAARWRFPAPTASSKRVRAWFTKKISFVLN